MRWPNYEVATRALPPQAVRGAMVATWVVQQVLLMILLSDKAGESNSYVQIASWWSRYAFHAGQNAFSALLQSPFVQSLLVPVCEETGRCGTGCQYPDLDRPAASGHGYDKRTLQALHRTL